MSQPPPPPPPPPPTVPARDPRPPVQVPQGPHEPSPDAIISTQGLTKRWGEFTALDGLSVEVGAGITGLLGSNGAGKTTLFGLLLGFHPATEGSIRVFGKDPRQFGREVRGRIGYAPEHDALPPDVRAQDFVRHMTELHGIPRRAALTRASDTLHLLGLGEERLRNIGTMSTGQKQRVKIAQALAHDPELLLLDEPTNGLDPIQREDMLRTIRRVGSELGINVVVSSHLITEVERICDGVVVLDAGRLAGSGAVGGLVGTTQTLVVEVDAGASALVRTLAAQGHIAQMVGPERFTVERIDDAGIEAVVTAVRVAGVGLRRLQPHSSSLEELFFTGAPQ